MFYDYKCPRCKRVFEVEHGMKEEWTKGCPKCDKWWWPFKKKVHKVFHAATVIWDENMNPQGVQTLMKRHELGLDWDDVKGQREAKELNKQMKEEGYRKAKRMAEQDEKVMAKQYKQVTEIEAMEILKDPNRKQDVHVVKPPTREEFGVN